jgi:hypothetical protein
VSKRILVVAGQEDLRDALRTLRRAIPVASSARQKYLTYRTDRCGAERFSLVPKTAASKCSKAREQKTR